MSRKRAFTKAVQFSDIEIGELWKHCSGAPTTPRKPNQRDLAILLMSPKQLVRGLGLTDYEVSKMLRGTSDRGIQLRFDSLMERLTQSFQKKKELFEKTWVPTPKTTALAIRKESPGSLVDATDVPNELQRKLGWDVFQNLTALARAAQISRGVLIRIQQGKLVRKSSRDKILALTRLSTKTIVQRLRPAA